MELTLKQIAHIITPFPEKFGVPRQSGLCKSVRAKVVFEPDYSDANAVRYLESFSHIWLIWGFSDDFGKGWSPTVRPPKLGGNERAGVFATRSPFRPNPIAISAVKLESIEFSEKGPVIIVSGADLVDGTPIYDIKPYVPYADCISEASPGISYDGEKCRHEVRFECEVPSELKDVLREVLSQGPNPAYINSEERVFKMSFESFTVSFISFDNTVTVLSVTETGAVC